jgi:hypothetical protein
MTLCEFLHKTGQLVSQESHLGLTSFFVTIHLFACHSGTMIMPVWAPIVMKMSFVVVPSGTDPKGSLQKLFSWKSSFEIAYSSV